MNLSLSIVLRKALRALGVHHCPHIILKRIGGGVGQEGAAFLAKEKITIDVTMMLPYWPGKS